ncbi:MAG: hypothetical protein HQL45_06295 [Alphaproteobacteria bacterium]|nr:hypothetical protein [Alphaproteobacteria bacterium]
MLAEALFCLKEAPFRRESWPAVREQAAILSRFRRHQAAWEPHLAASRSVILEAIQHCSMRDRAVILGSGLLLDVPIEELCRQFAQVVLVDLHHPAPARRMGRRHSNIDLLTTDIGAKDFWQNLVPMPDLLVSLNLAGQLALMTDGDDRVLSHLDGLRNATGTRVLITETMRLEHDEKGREIAREQALPEACGLEPPHNNWKWPLAPVGELAPYRGLLLDVGAWIWSA